MCMFRMCSKTEAIIDSVVKGLGMAEKRAAMDKNPTKAANKKKRRA